MSAVSLAFLGLGGLSLVLLLASLRLGHLGRLGRVSHRLRLPGRSPRRRGSRRSSPSSRMRPSATPSSSRASSTPRCVGAASAPIGEIDRLTVISTQGATALTKTVASNVAQGLQLGTDLTGIDLKALLAGLATGGAGNANGKPEAIEAK